MKTFIEWLNLREDERRTGTRTYNYPPGYGGVGLYPACDLMTHSADAAWYMTHDERKFWSGDGSPFSIDHLSHDIKDYKVKLPPDTSTQFKREFPADTSTQFKWEIPD